MRRRERLTPVAGPTPHAGRIDGGRYDIAIVGGGVVGCAIAWRLSSTRARVCLLEAAGDVGEGASKGNTGIATCGADCTPGTLEAELVTASAGRWEDVCRRLDTPWRRIGTLQVARSAEEAARLEELAAEARHADPEARVLSASEARRIEPLLADDAVGALHVPRDGIVDPVRLVVGYAELAARNGVDVFLDARVTALDAGADATWRIATARGTVAARFVVNAAGLGAAKTSALAGGATFRTWPRQGQYWLLDRAFGERLRVVVGGVPTPKSRGVYVVPTTNGSCLLGPTARDHDDADDRRVDAATLEDVWARCAALVPAIRRDQAIKTFAANRPASDRVYRVEVDEGVPGLVHAAGIRSTGVSSSPAVADRVHALLAGLGAPVGARPGALERLDGLPRLLHHPRPEELVARDPRYGQVVCACEQVSAAELDAALDAAVPPRTLDALRKRTRATGGRCQGAVCLAGVSFVLAARSGQAPWELAQGANGASVGVGPAAGA